MFAGIIIASIVLPLLASALPNNCARTYKVVEGDTCDAISAAHNASTYQFWAVNSPEVNDACTNLAIGQTVCLGTTGEDCTTTYVVKPNDTCDLITNSGLNMTILGLNNPNINSDCTNIYVGEVLCTASTVTVPPAPAGKPAAAAAIVAGSATATSPPQQSPAEDIPECTDPNDNGEW